MPISPIIMQWKSLGNQGCSKPIVFTKQKTWGKNDSSKTHWFCNENHSGTKDAQKPLFLLDKRLGAKRILVKPNGFAMKITMGRRSCRSAYVERWRERLYVDVASPSGPAPGKCTDATRSIPDERKHGSLSTKSRRTFRIHNHMQHQIHNSWPSPIRNRCMFPSASPLAVQW